MDLPGHFLWTFAIFKHFSWQLQAVFFGIFPDIFFSVAVAYFWLKAGRKASYGQLFPKVEPYYRLAHSALTMILVFFIISFYFHSFYWPVIAGWGLHLLLDLPFHKGGWVNGIAPLHPVYKRRIEGRWWWKEIIEQKPWIALANYSLALIVYFVA